MSLIQVSNIYKPVPFNDSVALEIKRNNNFLNSGLLYNNPDFLALAQAGGELINVPFWNPLGIAEPQYPTDTTTEITPKNLAMQYMKVKIQRGVEAWSEARLTQLVSGTTNGKGLDAVAKGIGKYWNTDINQRITNTLKGVILDNIANDAGDMIYKSAVEVVGDQSDATKINGENVLLALATMGEIEQELTGMVIHPVPYAKLKANNLIDFIPDSMGVVNIPTYMGMRVFVDAYAPTVAGTTSGTTYYTIFFGMGALGYAEIPNENASAIDKNELAGTGAGVETLVTRHNKIIHPTGFDWLVATGTNPAYSTLATAGSWNRLVDRNQVRIACLISN